MLKVREIQTYNFGPYRGRQSLQFRDEDGVTVIYGGNMRGKTTLLNAIRFALIGKIIGRGERSLDPRKLMNIPAQMDGEREFGVTAHLLYDKTPVEVRRLCTIQDGDPPSMTIDTTAVVDGVPLNRDETEQKLLEIMPEDISRFFLFDGELLQQYEELLHDESVTGLRIREAIEQILGLPVLINARADLGQVLESARKAETKAARQNQATEALASGLETLGERIGALRQEHKEIADREAVLESEKRSLEAALRRSQKTQDLLTRKNDCESRIGEIDVRVAAIQSDLGDLLQDGWLWPVRRALLTMEDEVTDQLHLAQEARAASHKRHALQSLIDRGITEGQCPVCNRPMSGGMDGVARDIAPDDVDKEDCVHIDEGEALSRLRAIQRLSKRPGPEGAIALMDEMHQLRAERAQKHDSMHELAAQLVGEEVAGLEQVQSRYQPTITAIIECRTALRDLKRQIGEAEASLTALQNRLKKTPGVEMSKETARREMAEALRNIFSRSIDAFRDELRSHVERDASKLFKALTTEPQFKGLRINSNYGLDIEREDGGIQPLRSSGAEHIVAFALVGALQHNSPLRGPLFIDSPFGRLDESHRRNVLRALPTMASQVVLLVYQLELDIEMARAELGSAFLAQHELVRQSATHTQIVLR